MKRNYVLFLKDILGSVENIRSFSKGLDKAGLKNNRLKQSAIVREIEIIGEAVKNLPISFREKYSSVPWRDIAGMRDVIIHSYFDIDLDAVWKTIKDDLPRLGYQIESILKQEVSSKNKF